MSEQRLATLTPFGKSDKKSNKSPRKTFRLRFILSDPNENSCPVFDYATAVKSEERKLLKKHREEKDKKPNGFVDPFEDDDEDVKRLARKFEAKYGDKKKLKSYAELGAGYDETDPFIDNTDANDEALQEDQETACGGYYINSGPLELKRVEVSDHSDADEVKKRGRKRALMVIREEEDDEEEEKEGEREKENEEEEEEDEAGEEAESQYVLEDSPLEQKQTKLLDEKPEPEKPPTPSYNGVDEVPPVRKKKKRVIEDDNTDGLFTKNKKAKTVKALLEEKRVQEQPTKVSEEPKKPIASQTSIAEAIESVVNAGNNQDENSNSSNSLQSATASSSVSDNSQDGKPESENSPPPLPDNLSPEVVSLVDQIKRTATVTDNTRKTFCSEINNSLIKLEWKTKELAAGSRNMLFAHLAHYLPCTKDTLMRRAKKLFIHKEESQMENIICKLKATIDATMPSLLEKYGKECQRIAEEKGLPSGDGNTPGDENQQASSSTVAKLPKRKFHWTEETRGYILSIYRCKKKCFEISKPRKSTWEDYLKTFLHSRIRTLWPHGWMKNSVLLKEINRSPNSVKSKHSSHHGASKAESSRLNVSVSFSSPTSSNGSLYVSPNGDTPQQSMKSPVTATTPLVAKSVADPINLLSKINSSFNNPPSQPKKSQPSVHHQNVKTEKPETFSMDCLLKRTSESSNCNDYNTSLSDLIKKEGVIMNGASLPLKHVNSSQKNDSSRSEKILDLSSCNSSVSGTPSVIQSAASSERTTVRNCDSASLRVSSTEKLHNHTLSSGREAMSNVPLNRKQRLLQVNSQTNRHSETVSDVSVIKKTDCVERPQAQAVEKMSKSCGGGMSDGPPLREREVDKETTTATDILSQIISESLRSPPQPHYTPSPVKTKEDMKSLSQGVHKDQELLYDVMQDLKELNHLSSGGARDTKTTSFTGGSWSYGVKSSESSKTNPYHNEFLKHLYSKQDTSIAASTPTPPTYSRHNASSYDNSAYVNEMNKSMYSPSPHRTSQSLTTHVTPSNKVTQMSQVKNLPNTGISSGLPHRYMGQMDYNNEDPHLMGLASSLQYSLSGWPYTGSESQSHQ